MAIVRIEGQEFPLDDAIVNGGATVPESDQLLRDALRPSFDLAAGAVFQRETRDGQLYITMVKRPGPKGGPGVLQRLLDAPAWLNPAFTLASELQLEEARGALDVEALLALQHPIDQAIRRGDAEERAIKAALRVLAAAPAVVGTDVPLGL